MPEPSGAASAAREARADDAEPVFELLVSKEPPIAKKSDGRNLAETNNKINPRRLAKG